MQREMKGVPLKHEPTVSQFCGMVPEKMLQDLKQNICKRWWGVSEVLSHMRFLGRGTE